MTCFSRLKNTFVEVFNGYAFLIHRYRYNLSAGEPEYFAYRMVGGIFHNHAVAFAQT
ncbi:hypothetical protein D3C75_1222760 [compost metagenome]